MINKMPALLARGLSVFALLCAALVCSSSAQSDNTQLSGFVKDQSGAVVAERQSLRQERNQRL